MTENGFAVSDETPVKYEHFRTVFGVHARVVKAILNRYPYYDPNYWHSDLNAGQGSSRCGDGSPIIAVETLREMGFQYKAILIERDDNTYAQLRACLAERSLTLGVEAFCEDHADVLPRYFDARSQRYGMIFADPSGDLPNFDLLAEASRQWCFRKTDILVYVSATNIKRQRCSPKCKCVKRFREYMALIDKRVWLVRQCSGRHQWTFLLGTNWDSFPEFHNHGFFKADSPVGQQVLEQLDNTATELKKNDTARPAYRTYAEYLRHPRFLQVREDRMMIANGRCELCRESPATEPHHLIYPAWGTFDTTANFLMVCHPCHCRIHRKES